ncbi:hypothetical protein [Bacillus sp. UNC438CL73TsuS30]|uniref:hypothetical protein n=1 Tax=Bacillus sp. UNC438CL73TsuS30 TaxID=1340434 RepID=UPI00047EC78D|nr:hypothetical protein [Bacillus sp. UNC438CL73TsuS30]
MTGNERLEKIKEVHLERIKQNELYTASFIHVDWLIEQAEKVERYEAVLKRIVKQTSCDDTWDFANRVLEGKPNNDLFYRMNID